MEGTFHYMLMAEQAMVQKYILRTLKDTGLTMGSPARPLSSRSVVLRVEIGRSPH